jgi:hypothetical protein
MKPLYLSDVYIIVSDLNYEGGETARKISRQEWYKTKRWDGYRYLIERCSPKRYNEVRGAEFSQQYNRAIQEKYNVGPNYKNNRWFMEQVRPSIY